MAHKTAEKALQIRKEMLDGKFPYFPVELSYVGHQVQFEDMHFDQTDVFLNSLRVLESTRKGEVLLDGGLRMKLWFRATPRGGLVISFCAEQFEPLFPGRCVLEGSFSLDGEFVYELVHSFEKLFLDGNPFTLRQDIEGTRGATINSIESHDAY